MPRPKKYNLTPLQADKLYHRWMTVKRTGICAGQEICVETLERGQAIKKHSCGICKKLCPELIRKPVPKSCRCPCHYRLIISKTELYERIKEALTEFYGEPVE